MSAPKNDDIRSALERVWQNSRPEAISRFATLKRFAEKLRSGTCDDVSRDGALLAAHRLSGSLGMFGFNEASSCAAKIEALLSDGPTPDGEVMVSLVERLRMLLEETQTSSGEPERHDS
ncbi:MAG TPA: Hpt domain-containing protein [Terriglobales bacterium]|nr:Hpt domain-containing protein [Terriglobales bacterium]